MLGRKEKGEERLEDKNRQKRREYCEKRISRKTRTKKIERNREIERERIKAEIKEKK